MKIFILYIFKIFNKNLSLFFTNTMLKKTEERIGKTKSYAVKLKGELQKLCYA